MPHQPNQQTIMTTLAKNVFRQEYSNEQKIEILDERTDIQRQDFQRGTYYIFQDLSFILVKYDDPTHLSIGQLNTKILEKLYAG